MRQVLYYPGILIPNDWLKKTILYSDKVSSIYPQNTGKIKGREEILSFSNMQYLESLGLYEYTHPEDLHYRSHRDIYYELTSILDEEALSNIRNNYRQHRTIYQIYRSKMNDRVIQFLLENDIAKLDNDFPNYIFVESNVGLLYMSLLAFYSTRFQAEFTPSTDEISHQNLVFNKNNKIEKDYYLNLIIEGLPSPSSINSIEDILDFKTNRREELLSFRRFIDEWIRMIQSGSANLNSFRDEFELYSNEISQMMKKSGISIVGNTLEVVVPPLTSIAVRYLVGNLDGSSIQDATSTTAAKLSIDRIKSRFSRVNSIKQNPLAYLYYAKREL